MMKEKLKGYEQSGVCESCQCGQHSDCYCLRGGLCKCGEPECPANKPAPALKTCCSQCERENPEGRYFGTYCDNKSCKCHSAGENSSKIKEYMNNVIKEKSNCCDAEIKKVVQDWNGVAGERDVCAECNQICEPEKMEDRLRAFLQRPVNGFHFRGGNWDREGEGFGWNFPFSIDIFVRDEIRRAINRDMWENQEKTYEEPKRDKIKHPNE